MAEPGLRERKKQRTRELIASTAARLFAEHGYEQVSVLDIAAAADVSEQTVYNHFPTKSALVLDRNQHLRDKLTHAIAQRPPGTSPAAAIRGVALALIHDLETMDDEQARGGLGHLAVHSPTVRRLALEMTDHHADAIAAVLSAEPYGPTPPLAKVRAIPIAWVIQTITDLAGQGTAAGRTPTQIAKQLRPTILAIIDDLVAGPTH